MAEMIRIAEDNYRNRKQSLEKEYGRKFKDAVNSGNAERIANVNEWFNKQAEAILNLWVKEMLVAADMGR